MLAKCNAQTAALIVSFIIACAPHPAAAQESIDCDNAQTTYEMNMCADRDFVEADRELNKVYQRAIQSIQNSDLDPPYNAKSWEAAMRSAQRAWLAYRDEDCKNLMPMEWSGGTGTTAAVVGCMTKKTKDRIDDLKERYDEPR